MPKHKTITTAAGKRFKAPKTGQIDHFDQSYPGLHLRVGARLRTWSYYYRLGGKLRRMKLDTFPPMTVAEAHDAWRQARDLVRAGEDPARSGDSGKVDFRSVFEEWMKRDQGENRSAGAVRQKLEKDVLPHWEHRPITDIGRRDCLDVIDRIVDRGAVVTARRVHAHLHRLFKWAVGRGILELNPLAKWTSPAASRNAIACSPTTSSLACGTLRRRSAIPIAGLFSC